MVFHQARHLIFSRLRSRENHDLASWRSITVLMLEHNQLLAPVAQQVSLQTWSSLGGIARRRISIFIEVLEGDDALSCRIIVLDAWRITTRCGTVSAIESLVVRIARPIDSEVGIRLFAGYHRIAGGTIAHISIRARPELESSVGRHEICRQSASVVSIARSNAKEFSGGGIVYIPAIPPAFSS